MPRPLEGVKVADFSHVMAGPFASHFLCLMGADVVKVEPPGVGDPMRNYGADRRYDGMAPAFIAANCGKRSIVLDLKTEGGREASRRLVAASDVVLENFRPGVMARLGLGYEACRGLRGDIVYCSVSGYGQAGPMRDYPAIDNIVQATSGLMSLNGERDGPFMRIGFPAVDTYAGTIAAMAILGALLRRERSGEGEHIDVSMVDASMVLAASAVVPFLVTGRVPERTGNTGYSGQPTAGLFVTKDGTSVSLGVVQQTQFERLCAAMDRRDLAADERFRTSERRRANAVALREELQAELLRRPGEEWERLLSDAGAPCGLVRDIAAAARLPMLRERGVIAPVRIAGSPDGEEVAVVGGGYVAASGPLRIDAPPPRLGEHTRVVLAELGYSPREVEELCAAGAAVDKEDRS
jgi:crotonobetainyl-CoA:carnitine CoA-transferase CaiB-like acyl-CoA transferase